LQTRKQLYNQLQVFSGGRLLAMFNWCWVAFWSWSMERTADL